ncbi:hypothetical protein [Streptomyces sp. H27-H1]|uniref:hypothetical protein n=1 Tax=Streptomyces sp. H27-H1 TaxID=2996461 RepID=UPI003B636652
MPSWRVHGRYVRRLGDAPVAGIPMVIELIVRRFKCLSWSDPTTDVSGRRSPSPWSRRRRSCRPRSRRSRPGLRPCRSFHPTALLT